MLLYDVGNTNIKCYNDGKITLVEDFDDSREFYYICVNHRVVDFKNGIDLAPYFKLKTTYSGMGIDRVAVCYGVDDGVVVDVGSAITVDVMDSGVHMGGFILPGLRAYKESFATISSSLVFDIDEDIDIEKLPQNTSKALNYALFKSIYVMIKDIAGEKKIYFCGGDGEIISRFFQDSTYKNDLVFLGMKKVIKEIVC